MIKVIENYQIKLKFEDKLRLLHLELFFLQLITTSYMIYSIFKKSKSGNQDFNK